LQVADASWVLALRPERHFTRDGKVPLTSRGNTRRSTSRAARLYNGDMLEDCQFWRSHLADGKPRIIRKVGGQHIVIDARLLSGSISWPGVPDDAKSYRNAAEVEDDLFSLSEYRETLFNGGDEDKPPHSEVDDE
jgi:hypothetical protein